MESELDLKDRTLLRWMNRFLCKRYLVVNCLADLTDGIIWANLLELTIHKRVPVNLKPKYRIHKIENWKINLDFMRNEGLKLVSMNAYSLVDGCKSLTLGLIWTYILRIPIQMLDCPTLPYTFEALLSWVNNILPNHKIQNFTHDWNDGKILCYLINELSPTSMNLPEDFTNIPQIDIQNGIHKAKDKLNISFYIGLDDMLIVTNPSRIAAYICCFREYEMFKMRQNMIENETYRTVNLILLLESLPFGYVPRNITMIIGILTHTFYEPYVMKEIVFSSDIIW